MNSVSGEATVAATITMEIFNERLKVNIVFLTILRREMRDVFLFGADVGQLGINEHPVVNLLTDFLNNNFYSDYDFGKTPKINMAENKKAKASYYPNGESLRVLI